MRAKQTHYVRASDEQERPNDGQQKQQRFRELIAEAREPCGRRLEFDRPVAKMRVVDSLSLFLDGLPGQHHHFRASLLDSRTGSQLPTNRSQ